MPNLVVYVPAALARELLAEGFTEVEQRKAARQGIEALLPGHKMLVKNQADEVVTVVDTQAGVTATGGTVIDRFFKPDPKK